MPSVTIDCYHRSRGEPPRAPVVVVIDVLRATTTAITAANLGFAIYPAATIEEAVEIAGRLDEPLFAGELGGALPYGFDLQNSPVAVCGLDGHRRPIVLLSTSGSGLMVDAAKHAGVVSIACLRNVSACAAHVHSVCKDVLILGADSRGEFRDEDKLCAARIAKRLAQAGFKLADAATRAVVSDYAEAPAEAIRSSRSATYLRQTGQVADLDFVISHDEDLDEPYSLRDGMVVAVG